jgi:hypothetical protein
MSERRTNRRGDQATRAGAFDATSFAGPARVGTPGSGVELHVCPECASGLVYPLDWAPAEERRWKVSLRCPDCEWRGGGVHDQAVVDRFDEALDLGIEQMLDDLNTVTRANREDQIARFVDALWADELLPEDF